MITTSWFGMMTHIRHPISIAIKAPSWYRNANYKELAPPYNLLRDFKQGRIEADEFKFRYEQLVLKDLDPFDVLNEIKRRCGLPLTSEENISLLSYERPGLVSHRIWVADFINQVLPEEEKIKELSLRDCQIDKYVVKHINLFRDQIPDLR